MIRMPPRQAEALAFIEAEVAAGRPSPSMSSIAKFMGWKNTISAHDCLTRLAGRGYLSYERRTSREDRRRFYHWKLAREKA